MEITAIFLNKKKEWKKVVMRGNGLYPNTYIWKNDVITCANDVVNVENYVNIKKYFIETHLDMILGEKEKIFQKIVHYLKPYNEFWIWVRKDSNL